MNTKEHFQKARIIIIDDDMGARESLEVILEDDYDVVCVADGLTGLEMIKKESFDMVLLDLTMPGINGIETLKRIKAHDPLIDVVMVSATDRARAAISAIQTGAYDYITKPFESQTILATVERVIEKRSLEQEVRYLRSEMALKAETVRIVSQSKSMKDVFFMIDRVAETSSSVLITGESGTGKELIAHAIHANSLRASKPFVAINCASIPSELVESELFGYEKGAFTGAHSRSTGKFEFAHGGTIFLDEISTLSLKLQAKLLRFLQEREFTKVGSNRTIKVDVRVVAATNTQLTEMIKENRFREDLYFRLNVIPIEVPPLRRRREDIPLLANYFLERFNRLLNKKIKGITSDVMEMLCTYPWPGNVRELENLIERMVVLGFDGQLIDEKSLPYSLLFQQMPLPEIEDGKDEDGGLLKAREGFERRHILKAMQKCRWNQTEAAHMLKIHRNTLINKLKALNLNRNAKE